MGNSAGKEQRPQHSRQPSSEAREPFHFGSSDASGSPQAASFEQPPSQHAESSSSRSVRPEFLASMGINGAENSTMNTSGWRKETKQEREARRLEKERVARAKERERSMKEEHVDGGYVVTQGVYTGTEDFNKAIVRQLMIERRIAPFWRGLQDHQDSWTEHQLVAAARGQPIPAPDEIPVDESEEKPDAQPESSSINSPPSNLEGLTLPIAPRSQSQSSEASSVPPSPFPAMPTGSSSLGSALAKGRSKTLATLTSSKAQSADIRPREIYLPKDSNVNGQRVEAYLYKDAAECPICFLYYPPYLNKTRCCDQAMCSECFVQIKRPEPHPPEHTDPTAPPPPPGELEAREGEFVSEPATCPFCKVPQFGITYDPPHFRRGLAYANHPLGQSTHRSFSGMSSSSSLASASENNLSASPTSTGRRRVTSVSATSPSVITTDQIRPDWAEKLQAARAHAARRSAAATALHTAAYMMGNRGNEDARGFAGFGRRGLLRRTSGGESAAFNSPVSHLSMLAHLSERNSSRMTNPDGTAAGNSDHPDARGRGRMEDLEEIMMMEAIRRSLASEDERRKREDKEAKKEAKRKDKEAKKAEKDAQKAAKRSSPYPSSANASTSALQSGPQTGSRSKDKHIEGGDDISRTFGELNLATRPTNPQSHLERARAQFHSEGSAASSPGTFAAPPFRPSHLRTQSTVSSSASSIEDGSPPGSLLQDPREPTSSLDASPAGSRLNVANSTHAQEPFLSSSAAPTVANNEPMLNFRSLAAMVGDDDSTRETDAAAQDGPAPASSENQLKENSIVASSQAVHGSETQADEESAATKAPGQHKTLVHDTEESIPSRAEV